MARERLEYDVIATDRNSKRTFDDVADSIDGAKRSMDDLGKQSQHLDAEILRLERSTKELIATFRSTDDVELFKQFKKDQRLLNTLRRMKKEFGDAGDDAATGFAASFMARVGPVMARMPFGPTGLAVGAGIGAAAAPVLASSIAGAVTIAVTGGVVAAGIALAGADPAVKAAATGLGQLVQTELTGAASAFKDETVSALGVIGLEVRGLRPELDAVFGDASRYVQPLARGVAGAFREAVPGIRSAVHEAEPLIDMLEVKLPSLGRTLGDVFETFADSAGNSADAIAGVLTMIEATLGGTANMIKLLSDIGPAVAGPIYALGDATSKSGKASGEAEGKAREFAESLRQTGERAREAAADEARAAAAAKEAGERAEKAARQYEDLFKQWMDADTSAIAMEAAFDDVTESIKDNGHSLDVNTEAGRANRSALLDAVEAAKRHEEAMIRGGQSTSYANQVFLQTVQRLRDQAAAAGADTTELDRLLGKYIQLANAPNIVKTITYKQVFTSSGQAFQPVGGGHAFFSHGGLLVGPGSGTSDDIVARVSNGEYVLRAGAVRALGIDTLDALNQADRTGLRGPTPGPVSAGGPVAGGGPDVVRAFETALERVLGRATLRVDDRTARFADLLARAG